MTRRCFALQLQNLSKYYGPFCAVKDVSLEIKEGEIFALLGPNGAGKSSIISMVASLEKPTDGQILIGPYDVQKQKIQAKSILGVVPQEIVHHGFFTVQEILQFHSGYYGISNNHAWIEFLLHKLNLWQQKDKRVKELSGGMKRRLLIAKALVHKPKLLLLDEPTAGVDIELRASLWQFIKQLNQEGTSILLTTHYLQEVEQLCHRVAVINKGQLLRVGGTQQLIATLTQRKLEITLKEPLLHLPQSPYLLQRDLLKLTLQLPHDAEIGPLLLSLQIDLNKIQDIQIQEGSLEEALLHVLEGDLHGK